MALVTINGLELSPNPSRVPLGQYRISEAGRSANGTMLMEIIAIKKQISIEYDKISESKLRPLLNLLEGATFFEVTYPDPQGADGKATKTMYAGDITMEPWHKDKVTGERWWSDVKIGLVER